MAAPPRRKPPEGFHNRDGRAMSWQALGWAWTQQLDNPAAKLLLVAMADKASEQGLCDAEQQQLCADCEVSVRTLRRRLRDLEAAGYLAVSRKRGGTGQLGCNAYQLLLANHRPTVADGGLQAVSQVSPANGHRPPVADGTAGSPSATAVADLCDGKPEELRTLPVATPSASLPGAATASSSRRTRDLLWDVLDEFFGKPSNREERSRRGRALTSIRESLGVGKPSEATPFHAEVLRQRCTTARTLWQPRGITHTEMAIAANWRNLDPSKEVDLNNLSAEAIFAMTRGMQ